MAYKRFVYRKGKKFGPYFYESYRDKGGEVRKRYIGTEDPDIKKRDVVPTNKLKKVIFVSVAVLIFGFFLGIVFLNLDISGRALLDVESSYVLGENISGILELGMEEGELLPLDSEIVFEIEGTEKVFLFSNFVNENISGNFYVSGSNVSGEGAGFGFVGEREIYPDVYFTLIFEEPIVDAVGGGSVSEEPIVDEVVSDEVVSDEAVDEVVDEEVVVDEVVVDEVVVDEVVVDEKADKKVEKEVAKEEKAVAKEEAVDGGIITGAVVSSSGEVDGVVSVGNPFVYNIGDYDVSVKDGSVHSDYGDEFEYEFLDLNVEEEVLTVETDYSVMESGFGEEYLTGRGHDMEIDFGRVGIEAVEGNLVVKIVYGGEVLARASKEISIVEAKIVVNETLNESLVNVTYVVSNNATTLQYKAVIGKPVKWLKKVNVKDDDLRVEIPKGSVNVSVLIDDEVGFAEREARDYGVDIEEVDRNLLISGEVTLKIREKRGVLTKAWDWFTGLFDERSITGNVVGEVELEAGGDIVETYDVKTVDVGGIVNATDADEIAIEYTTPAPVAFEEDISGGKRVTVSADDIYNYTDVLAYSLVGGKVPVDNSEKLKVYWLASREDAIRYGYIEGTKKEIKEIEKEDKKAEKDIAKEDKKAEKDMRKNESVLTLPQVPSEEGNESVGDGKVKDEKGGKNKSVEGGVGFLTGNVVFGEGDNGTRTNADDAEGEGNVSVNYVRVLVNYSAHDLDGDGFVDYVEWVVPHLSEQVYEIIIEISEAEHLDSNRSFVADVYDYVSARDDNWTTIPDGDYLRVRFERELDLSKDITVVVRSVCNESVVINGTEVPCEIYEKKMRLDEIRKELNQEGGNV